VLFSFYSFVSAATFVFSLNLKKYSLIIFSLRLFQKSLSTVSTLLVLFPSVYCAGYSVDG
jgi:hypothetical protein